MRIISRSIIGKLSSNIEVSQSFASRRTLRFLNRVFTLDVNPFAQSIITYNISS